MPLVYAFISQSRGARVTRICPMLLLHCYVPSVSLSCITVDTLCTQLSRFAYLSYTSSVLHLTCYLLCCIYTPHEYIIHMLSPQQIQHAVWVSLYTMHETTPVLTSMRSSRCGSAVTTILVSVGRIDTRMGISCPPNLGALTSGDIPRNEHFVRS